jgi:hypothetical protein
MTLSFRTGTPGVVVGTVYLLLGVGIGLAGPPSSSALMGSVPVRRAGMGSASNDLQRDFGGALFQALMGTVLAIRYTSTFAKAFSHLPPEQAKQLSSQAAATISQSFTGAEQVAKQFPQAQSQELVAAARQAFVHGKTGALVVATLAAAAGFVLVVTLFPRREDELRSYRVAAGANEPTTAEPEPATPPTGR